MNLKLKGGYYVANAGNVDVDFNVNLRNLNASFRTLNRTLQRMNRSVTTSQRSISTSTITMGNAYAKMGEMAVRALGKVISKTVEFSINSAKMAIQSENDMMQINRIFGESATAINDFSDSTARDFNMSAANATKFASVFGNLISGYSKDQQENAQLTERLLKQSAVTASATGRTMEDVMDRIRSGLLGGTEAIEDLGINVNVGTIKATKAFRKFAGDKSWLQLEERTKQQIRLMAILEQSTEKYGTEINQNTNSDLQKLSAILDDISLKLGQAFLPMLQEGIPILINFAEKLETMAEKLKIVSELLFGTPFKPDAKKGIEGITEETEKLEEQAKATRNAFGSFDEINVLPIIKAIKKAGTGLETVTDTAKETDEGFIGPIDVPKGTPATKGLFGDISTDLKDRIDLIREIAGETFDLEEWGKAIKGAGEVGAALGAALIDKAYYDLPSIESVGASIWNAIKDGFAVEANASGLGSGEENVLTKNIKKMWEDSSTTTDDKLLTMKDSVKKTIEVDIPALIDWNKPVKSFNDMWSNSYNETNNWMYDIKERVKKTVEKDMTEGTEVDWEKPVTAVNKMWSDSYDKTNNWMYSIKERVKKTVEKDMTEGKEVDWSKPVTAVSNMWDKALEATKNKWKEITDYVNGEMSKIGGGSVIIPEINTPNTESGKSSPLPDNLPKSGVDAKGMLTDDPSKMVDFYNPENLKKAAKAISDKGTSGLFPFADGGIVTGPTRALIGEAGAEAVIPLENGDFVASLASAIGEAVASAIGPNSNSLNIDGVEMARAIIPHIDRERSRQGDILLQG